MAADDGAERSHAPSQKRLDEARRDGRVLTSKEMMVFAGMVTGTLLLAAAPALATRLAARWSQHLRLGSDALDAALLPALGTAGWEILALALIVAIPVGLATVIAQIAMGGLNWSAKGFGFNFDRLDPGKGLARMVSANSLVELVKAVAKVVLLLAVTLWSGLNALPEIRMLGSMATSDAVAVTGDMIFRLLVSLTLVLGLIGIADLAWQALTMQRSLRMTLDEVKRENREDNGSPELKGRMRRLQIEASQRSAQQRAALKEVPTASAVITNPTHFAVAIRYLPGADDAPTIIATGSDLMAGRVIEKARRAGVPILGLPLLARALYFTGEIGMIIDTRLYSAVATVLAHIWRVERGLREELPSIELPDDLRLNSRGQPER